MILSIDKLISKYNLKIRGVIHAGAHFGEEFELYKNKCNVTNCIFFEPVKSNFAVLVKRLEKETDVFLVNKALGSESKKSIIHIDMENEGQSSSILNPKLHLNQYPHITFKNSEEIEVIRLDDFIKEYQLENDYNFLNMDVQGYELEILKGAEQTLLSIDYIVTEVNREELYENCARVEQMDSFLSKFNFQRVETDWAGVTWGDAFYIKNK